MASSSDNITDPYYFRPLYSMYRNLIQLLGSWPETTIEGFRFLDITTDHDSIRRLVSWNFIAYPTDSELAEYEQGLFVSDFDMRYSITNQARAFARLEKNNISDLDKAILILLRADSAPEQRMGFLNVPLMPTIGFYQLVMLLDKSEHAMLNAINRLLDRKLVDARLVFTEEGRVWSWASSISITDHGLFYLEEGGKIMNFNNINISNSNVGVFAFQSTLSNIDVHVGSMKQKGHDSIAEALTKITEQITLSPLPENEKRDILEQIEVISEQGAKEPAERKSAPIKGALAYLEKSLTSIASLATAWATFGPVIISFFGM